MPASRFSAANLLSVSIGPISKPSDQRSVCCAKSVSVRSRSSENPRGPHTASISSQAIVVTNAAEKSSSGSVRFTRSLTLKTKASGDGTGAPVSARSPRATAGVLIQSIHSLSVARRATQFVSGTPHLLTTEKPRWTVSSVSAKESPSPVSLIVSLVRLTSQLETKTVVAASIRPRLSGSASFGHATPVPSFRSS